MTCTSTFENTSGYQRYASSTKFSTQRYGRTAVYTYYSTTTRYRTGYLKAAIASTSCSISGVYQYLAHVDNRNM
jgi:hypothetical protein